MENAFFKLRTVTFVRRIEEHVRKGRTSSMSVRFADTFFHSALLSQAFVCSPRTSSAGCAGKSSSSSSQMTYHLQRLRSNADMTPRRKRCVFSDQLARLRDERNPKTLSLLTSLTYHTSRPHVDERLGLLQRVHGFTHLASGLLHRLRCFLL